jgi:hypothetical protein
LVEIPSDTVWYEVRSLTENEIDELFVSARHNDRWNRAGNKLTQVAVAARETLTAATNEWPRILLWGHDRSGPFSIFDGNHRMIAYAAANPRPSLKINVYVGLSPSYCYWHYADPCRSIREEPERG